MYKKESCIRYPTCSEPHLSLSCRPRTDWPCWNPPPGHAQCGILGHAQCGILPRPPSPPQRTEADQASRYSVPAGQKHSGIQCWGIRWYFGADPDPHLWLTDPDPTTFFTDFKDAKNAPKCQKFCVKFYFASIISVCSTPLWEMGRIRIRTSD